MGSVGRYCSPELIDIRLIVLLQIASGRAIEAQQERVNRMRAERPDVVNEGVVTAILGVIPEAGQALGFSRHTARRYFYKNNCSGRELFPVAQAMVYADVELIEAIVFYRLPR